VDIRDNTTTVLERYHLRIILLPGFVGKMGRREQKRRELKRAAKHSQKLYQFLEKRPKEHHDGDTADGDGNVDVSETEPRTQPEDEEPDEPSETGKALTIFLLSKYTLICFNESQL